MSDIKKSYSVSNIRRKYKKAYERWTSEEDRLLKDRYVAGDSISSLASLLQRQSGAIKSRLRKLALFSIPEAPQRKLENEMRFSFGFHWETVKRSPEVDYFYPESITSEMVKRRFT